MSFRVRRRLPVWLAAASLVTASGAVQARDYHRPAALEPLHHDNDHEIIFEMEPMHPVKRSVAQPARPVAKQTEQAKKIEPAKPAMAAQSAPAPAASPAPIEAAKAQPEASKVDAPAAPVEASKTAQKPVEAAKADEDAHMALTPPAPAATPAVGSATQQPPLESAAPATPVERVPDASQPTPLPLDQALHPAPAGSGDATAAPTPSAANPASAAADAAAAVAAAPAEQAPPASTAAQPEPAKSESTSPANADKAATLDPAAEFASLMAKAVKGPVEVRIADRATLFLPAGRSFIADDAARELAKLAGFDWRPTMRGLIAPTGDKLEWLAPVEVLDDGYIKSDAALDADKLLGAFSAGLPEVNTQRAKAGQPAVELSGWLTAPALDEKHRLSACVNVMTQGGDDKYFNCEAWALGRDGAIKISLAEGGESGERLKGEAKALAEAIVYDHGTTYEEVDLGADRVAPYAAGDLLTSDVTAKVANGAPAADEAGSAFDWFGLALPLAAVAGLGALFMLRRRSEPTDTAPARTTLTDQQEPTSLFAKLLPSLYARFGGKNEASKPAAPAAVVETKTAAPAGEMGGLLSKLPGLRNRSAKEPSGIASAPAMDEADAASALQKLASRMRRSAAEETSPEKVDVSRVMRAARPLPGAAPEAAAPSPKATSSAPAAPARASAEPDVGFGLVEPGDPEATSAAMHAREALRQANG